jgi:uncharacterized phage infection (PIP) family protein YhgE
MATLDDAVTNLQRFIGHLVEAAGTLGHVSDHLEETARQFAQLEDAAEDEGNGLAGHVDEALSALSSGLHEVEDALHQLDRAAGDSERSLGQGKETIEQTAADLEEKVRTTLTDVDEGHGALSSEGFQALGHTLDELEQELATEWKETGQALNDLETNLQGQAKEAQEAWDEAEAALDSATAEAAAEESQLESEGTDGVSAFEAAAGEAESHCTSLDQELDVVYGALTSGVDAQGGEWEHAIQDLAQSLVAFVQDGERDRLQEPAALLDEDALDALGREYDALSAGLGAATSAVAELDTLADDLVKSQAVVGQVGELMNALGG